MLGLSRGVVRLVEHDTTWLAEFGDERARLRRALANLGCEIEHIGSTAVPGLAAKPILDIAVGYPASTVLAELQPAVERLAYEYRGNCGDEGGYVFVRGTAAQRTHHLHAVPLRGEQWTAYLRLRDLLRADAQARELYASAKAELAIEFAKDRKSYTQGKAGVIRRLLAASCQSARSRSRGAEPRQSHMAQNAS